MFLLILLWSCFGPAVTASAAHRDGPCFVDDLVAALHDATGKDGELLASSPASFGICSESDSSPRSVLSELSVGIRRNDRKGVEVLDPAAVLVSDEDDQEGLMVTFDLPQSQLLKLKPVLVLAFKSPPTDGELGVTFSSQSLQPNTQSACFSGRTLYILLTGKSSEGNVEQKWNISVQAKSPSTRENLKDVLIGGKSGSDVRLTPILLFAAETGTDTRHANGSGSSAASSQTTSLSFLCELRRFLDAGLPQQHAEPPLLRLDSLQALPPLALGLSTSETLLAEIINSSAPTIFSFSSWSSSFPVRPGQLALSPALLGELGQRLETNERQIRELIRQGMVPQTASEKLERLRQLSAFQKQDSSAEGESQYCAFLLLKALQMVTRAYNMQRKLRATRAGPSTRGPICGLGSLTVSLEKLVLGPQSADLNNCRGSCAIPLINGNNHAVLLTYHTERGDVNERGPCCVPLAYDPLEVIDWNDEGSFLTSKPDMVAKECGCR
ncbi:muellerian-inhibiting factor [Poecilia reticulata]|uniref:Anti-Mullerian hormone n=1 Tax=Poecilia reticulata TaxID=8081 RepID=A0A3P9NUA6_POERE|nr:PREDICTED: muellerian-inhibiting factor [Poecilia reticulata]